MHYTNHQTTPVFSSDCQPLMPTHPAKARKLLQKGRAVPHHVKGLFGIRLLDRTRDESSVQDVAINIDPGSQTTGIAVVADDENGQRTVLAALKSSTELSPSRPHSPKGIVSAATAERGSATAPRASTTAGVSQARCRPPSTAFASTPCG